MCRNYLLAGWMLCFAPLVPLVATPKPEWAPVTPEELAEQAPRLEPQAPAEILTCRIEMKHERDGDDQRITHVRLKIYDPARSTELTRLALFSTNDARTSGWWKRQEPHLQARLTLPDGTSRIFGERDARSRNVAEEGRANGFLGFLSGRGDWSVEQKFLAITGVTKGAVLDLWQWEPDVPALTFVAALQRPELPVRHVEYISRYDENPRRLHRFYVLQPQSGKFNHDAKARVATFTAENLPSLRRESYAAPDTYRAAAVIEAFDTRKTFLTQRSKKVRLPEDVKLSLGPWVFFATEQDYYDADSGYANDRVKKKAQELVAGAADDREKARRIYAFVQEVYQRFRSRADLENMYTRYIDGVEELIDLDKIDSTIIDPEDFRYLFIALLRSAGLECHTAMHPSRSSFPFNVGLVARPFVSGRSVAVKIEGAWVFCDPCTRVPYAFGTLPWDRENQPALLAQSHQQEFVTVPVPPASQALAETTGDFELSPDGTLQGECVRTLHGHSADAARERLVQCPRDAWWTLLGDLSGLQSTRAELTLIGVEGLEMAEQPVRIRFSARWPNCGAATGSGMLLGACVLREGRGPLLPESSRTAPVFFHFPVQEREQIRIHLPPDLRPDAVPKPITASAGPFSYSLAVTFDAARRELTVNRESVNGVVDVQPDLYPPVRDWFRRVAAADQTTLVLSRAADGSL